MGKLTLIGCVHHTGEFLPPPGNYERVRRILEAANPGFVSQEVRLFYHLSQAFEPLLSASLHELTAMESRIIEESSYGSEYEAGIIYCRRNNIPLHWTDLYSATQEEVVETDILKVSALPSLWSDEREIPERLLGINPETGDPMYFDVSERNVFTGNALSELLRKYSPQDGVHICGKNHYQPRKGLPLQVILSTCSFKPDEVLFEPRIDE